MRTTIEIADPVLADVRRVQQEEGKSLGQTITELLAEGLAARRANTKRPRLRWIAKDLGARVDLRDQDAVWTLLDRETTAPR
jgi:hypothetical protein